MLVRHYTDVEARPVDAEGARNATIRVLIGPDEKAPTFNMRLFEIGPDGATPHHAHAWEHEVFIVEGTGTLVGEGTSHPLRPGDSVFVPGGEVYHFESSPGTVMKMLCLVPAETA